MLPRQCQTNGFERLEVTDNREDMMWRVFNLNTPSKGTSNVMTYTTLLTGRLIKSTPARCLVTTYVGMAELGVGFGLYFNTMFKLILISIVATVVTLPNWAATGRISGNRNLLAMS